MPTLPEILDKLPFLSATSAIVGLAVAAGLIVLVEDWRLSLAALLAQYTLVGILLTGLIFPRIALIKVIVGALICAVLYLTALYVSAPRDHGERDRGVFALGLPFRLLAVPVVGLAAAGLAGCHPLPQVPSEISFACYWLSLVGLLALMLTEEPLKAGQGLLTFVLGFELFYANLEQSLAVIGLLGMADLLLALAIAYLSVAGGRGLADEEER